MSEEGVIEANGNGQDETVKNPVDTTMRHDAIQKFGTNFEQWLRQHLLVDGGSKQKTTTFDHDWFLMPDVIDRKEAKKHVVKTTLGLNKTWEEIQYKVESLKAIALLDALPEKTCAQSSKMDNRNVEFIIKSCDDQARLVLSDFASSAKELVVARYDATCRTLGISGREYISFIWPTQDIEVEAGKCLSEAMRLLDQISIARFDESLRGCSYFDMNGSDPTTIKSLSKNVPKEAILMSEQEYRQCISHLMNHHKQMCKDVTGMVALIHFVVAAVFFVLFLETHVFKFGLGSDTIALMLTSSLALLAVFKLIISLLRADYYLG